jgi:hypothetical protein
MEAALWLIGSGGLFIWLLSIGELLLAGVPGFFFTAFVMNWLHEHDFW